VSAWVDLVAPAWAGGAVPAWGGVVLALLALRDSLVRPGSLVQAGLLGRAEALGPEEESGQADGQAADGPAGAVVAGGRGGVSAPASHWPPGGPTTAATVTTIVSSGGLIGAG